MLFDLEESTRRIAELSTEIENTEEIWLHRKTAQLLVVTRINRARNRSFNKHYYIYLGLLNGDY